MSTPEISSPTPQDSEALRLLAHHMDDFKDANHIWRTDPDPACDELFTAFRFQLNADRVPDVLQDMAPRIDLPGIQLGQYSLYVERYNDTPAAHAASDRQAFISLDRTFQTSDLKGEMHLEATLLPVAGDPQALNIYPNLDVSTRDIEYESWNAEQTQKLREGQRRALTDPDYPPKFTDEQREAILREIERRNAETSMPEDSSRRLDPRSYLSPVELAKCRNRLATTEEIMKFAHLIGSLQLLDIKSAAGRLL